MHRICMLDHRTVFHKLFTLTKNSTSWKAAEHHYRIGSTCCNLYGLNNVRDLYRGINDFKKGYQPRTTLVKDEKGDFMADSHSIMARWRNYFSQLLNVHEVNNIRQAEIHTVEPLVLEPSAFEVELAIEKLKNHKSPGIDQIPAELIKAGGRTIRCEIHKLIISIWNKEELPDEWK